MKPLRHFGLGILTALVCLIATSASSLLAQPVVSIEQDPYRKLEELDTPWGLPDELTDRLARRAAEYETAAPSLECRETTRSVRYPRSDRPAEGDAREATYLLTLEDGSMVPVRGHERSLSRSGRSAVPPAHAWTQLFASYHQPYFAYRDVGEVPYGFGTARRIQFRGAVPHADGADIREWEGTVLVDSVSLLPLELDAQPFNLWPRLEHQRREYAQSFKLVFFGLIIRFKPRPIAERVHVRFDMQDSGLTLPVEAYVETVEKIQADQAIVRSRLLASYEHGFTAIP